jgi:hypothetical protein
MRNFFIFIVFTLSTVLISCNTKVLTEDGEKYIHELNFDHKCLEIIVNKAHVSNFKNKDNLEEITINVRGCEGKLSLENLKRNDSIIYEIANNVAKRCLDISSYSRLYIECSPNSKDTYAKTYTFSLKSGVPELLEKSEMSKL